MVNLDKHVTCLCFGQAFFFGVFQDSKTGQFQAVGKIVHLTEPIVEAHNICPLEVVAVSHGTQ